MLDRCTGHRQQREIGAFAHVEAAGVRLQLVRIIDQLRKSWRPCGDPALLERPALLMPRRGVEEAERIGPSSHL
jgi:hypothetical protein